MFVVFKSPNEAIITTKKKEAETIELFFINGGRNLEDYDRETIKECALSVESSVKLF